MPASGMTSPTVGAAEAWTSTMMNPDAPPFTGSTAEPSILVVDPATRKLSIPYRAVLHTQALNRLDRVPSICMLYLQGRCRQGPACHQLHADPMVVEMLRSEASQRTSCCPEHGEEVTQPNINQLLPAVEGLSIDGHFVSAGRVATTTGIRRLANERQPVTQEDGRVILAASRSQICRLHVLGRCRYAEDCNFVHLCRSLTDGEDDKLSHDLQHAAVVNTPSKTHRPTGFTRGSPSNQFVAQMPPSPLYGGHSAHMPNSFAGEQYLSLDNENSQETTPPSTPAIHGVSTPLSAWRHEPYSWNCVSPVRATPPAATA